MNRAYENQINNNNNFNTNQKNQKNEKYENAITRTPLNSKNNNNLIFTSNKGQFTTPFHNRISDNEINIESNSKFNKICTNNLQKISNIKHITNKKNNPLITPIKSAKTPFNNTPFPQIVEESENLNSNF